MPCRVPATTTLQFNFIYDLLHFQRHTRKWVSSNLSNLLSPQAFDWEFLREASNKFFPLLWYLLPPHPTNTSVTQTSLLHKPAYVCHSVFFVRSSEGFGSLLASSVEGNYSDKTTWKTEASKELEAYWSTLTQHTPVKESAQWNVKCFCEKMNLEFSRYMGKEQQRIYEHVTNMAVYPKSLTGEGPNLLEILLTWMRDVSIWLRVNPSVPVRTVCSQEGKSLWKCLQKRSCGARQFPGSNTWVQRVESWEHKTDREVKTTGSCNCASV